MEPISLFNTKNPRVLCNWLRAVCLSIKSLKARVAALEKEADEPGVVEGTATIDHDLTDMTKAELLNLAANKGLDLKKSLTKAKIIEAIEKN